MSDEVAQATDEIPVVKTPKQAFKARRAASKWDVLEKYLAKAIEIYDPTDEDNVSGVLYELGSAKYGNLRTAVSRTAAMFPNWTFTLSPAVPSGRELGRWIITAMPKVPAVPTVAAEAAGAGEVGLTAGGTSVAGAVAAGVVLG